MFDPVQFLVQFHLALHPLTNLVPQALEGVSLRLHTLGYLLGPVLTVVISEVDVTAPSLGTLLEGEADFVDLGGLIYDQLLVVGDVRVLDLLFGMTPTVHR